MINHCISSGKCRRNRILHCILICWSGFEDNGEEYDADVLIIYDETADKDVVAKRRKILPHREKAYAY